VPVVGGEACYSWGRTQTSMLPLLGLSATGTWRYVRLTTPAMWLRRCGHDLFVAILLSTIRRITSDLLGLSGCSRLHLSTRPGNEAIA
jgi:hypothetical protein